MRRAAIFLFVFVLVTGNGHAGVTEAQAALEAKNFASAIKLATDGLRQPDLKAGETQSLHIIRGRALFGNEQLPDAVAELSLVLDHQPADAAIDCNALAKAYLARTMTYLRMAKASAAEADLNRIIACNPNDAEFQLALGTAFGWLGNDRRAVAFDTAAIKIKPDYAEAYGARAPAHQNLGEYLEALADYSEAIRLDAKNASYYGNRATVYHHLSRFDDEAADLEKSIALDPKDWASHLRRAELNVHRANLAAAEADLEVAKARLDDFYRAFPDEKSNPGFQDFIRAWLNRVEAALAVAKKAAGAN